MKLAQIFFASILIRVIHPVGVPGIDYALGPDSLSLVLLRFKCEDQIILVTCISKSIFMKQNNSGGESLLESITCLVRNLTLAQVKSRS
jgi:hypothetical protein